MELSQNIQDRLKQYYALLQKWQPKINLISNSTLHEAWKRHFEDSLQLLDILPDTPQVLFDIGTGAGFPGLVLAIANDKCDVHLIESDQKKCSFLKTVSRETETKVHVINERIENVGQNIVPDIVTARALASLNDLFEYCDRWIAQNSDLQLVFMKGERADEELSALEGKWKFSCRTYASVTNENAKILVFTDICRL